MPRSFLAGVSTGVVLGFLSAPFAAAALNVRHPDEADSTYWDRVGRGWWWHVRSR